MVNNLSNFVDTKLIDQSIDSAVNKLVTSTLDNLSVDRIHRIDVSFEIPERY